MVARNDHHMAPPGGSDTGQEMVVQLLGMVARRAVVEDIPRHKKHIDILFFDDVGQPVKEGLKFLVSLAAIQCPADMPV